MFYFLKSIIIFKINFTDAFMEIGITKIKKNRSSRLQMFHKIDVLKDFAKFTGKHLCRSLFLNELGSPCNFIKKEIPTQVFSCEFCKIFKNTFFTEHTQTTAPERKNVMT